MKLLHTQITPFINNSLHVELRDQPYLFSPIHGQPCFHSHPELELVYIMEGYGKRIIGNNVSNFKAGDMVFIGSDVPHIWLSDHDFYKKDSSLRSRVLIMYINPQIFELLRNFLKELDGVKDIFQQACRGINIFGKTRTLIAEKLMQFSSKTGLEKSISLLEIINLISLSTERVFIEKKEFSISEGLPTDRLIDIFKYTAENFHREITLKEISGVACLEIPSFCRFFKKRTKMTFSQYLVIIRMNFACKLLIELDKPISEIAYMCGYNSTSHFGQVFKDFTKQSPHQFRHNVS
jgi:AraC-like DNA-binding protein